MFNRFWADRKTRSILSDFPWLWAVRQDWHPARTAGVTVYSDIEGLSLYMGRQSDEATEVWIFTCTDSSRTIRRVPAVKNCTWAELIERHRGGGYIGLLNVLVCTRKEYIILRHPKKALLDEDIASVARLVTCG